MEKVYIVESGKSRRVFRSQEKANDYAESIADRILQKETDARIESKSETCITINYRSSLGFKDHLYPVTAYIFISIGWFCDED